MVHLGTELLGDRGRKLLFAAMSFLLLVTLWICTILFSCGDDSRPPANLFDSYPCDRLHVVDRLLLPKQLIAGREDLHRSLGVWIRVAPHDCSRRDGGYQRAD